MYAGSLLELLAGAAMLGVVVLILRWAVGTGAGLPHPKIDDPDDATGDGLLVEVARLPTEAAALVLRARLRRAGIRATVGGPPAGVEGYRLLVFPADVASARLALR